ncbi:MAG TPA: TIM barrel protein [bacterium]|nr:TIM barrel protein [bacterium]HPG45595.1 TIM barrel protein [bacterium]HPM97626.1 TIM barrel protein [bacterium]
MQKNGNNRIGFTIQPFRGYRPSLILAGLKALGVQFFELAEECLYEIEQIKKHTRNLQTGFHLPIQEVNGWDFTQSEQVKKIDRMIEILNRHQRDLNLQYVVAHPPEADCVDRDRALAFLCQNLSRLNMPIFIENIATNTRDLHQRDLQRIRAALGNQVIRQCFDAAHYYIQGEDPVILWQKNHTDVGLVHLSDCSKKHDEHWPFGVGGGELPIDPLLAALQQQRYTGYIALEIMPRNSDQLTAYIESYLKVVRSIAPEAYSKTRMRIRLLSPLLKAFFSRGW